jgi:hypothetical protein
MGRSAPGATGNPYVVSDNETIVAAPSPGADTAFPASMIHADLVSHERSR